MALPDKIRFLRVIGAYKRLFLDGKGQLNPDARIVLDDLYKQAHLYSDTAVEPYALCFAEGKRNVVRHILRRTKTSESELQRHLLNGDDDE